MAKIPRRQTVAEAMLRLLAGVPAAAPVLGDGELGPLIADRSSDDVFAPTDKQMIRGVLGLADRLIGSIITPRAEVLWRDLDDPQKEVLATLRSSPPAQLP